MNADFTTIEVHGVPSGFPEERMIDKLTIHFLRPRNGGGEVLRVLYSSRNPHLAFVIFEQSNVAARVLQRAQVLQVGGKSHHLTLTRGERAEDLPVRTTLDLRRFGNQAAVLPVLSRYGLKVSQEHSGRLLLEGTFLSLRAARVELSELLPPDGRSPSQFVPSAGAVSKRSRPSDELNGPAARSGSRGAEKAEHSPASSPSLALPRLLDAPRSGGSAAGLPSDPLPGGRRPGSRRGDRASFQVDTDALRYARAFLGRRVEEVLRAHGVEMEEQDLESAEVSAVVLTGLGAAPAKDELARVLTEVQGSLRTQDIPLSSLSREQQHQVAKRVQTLSGVYKVLVRQVGDTLRLVGPSVESYDMKQRILGEEASPHSFRLEGIGQERGRQLRRSSSLPRQPSRESLSGLESSSAVAGGLAGRGSVHGAGSVGPTPPTERHLRRSVSEVRAKAKEGRPTPAHGAVDRAPPAVAPMTPDKEQSKKKKSPVFPKSLVPEKAKAYLSKQFK